MADSRVRVDVERVKECYPRHHFSVPGANRFPFRDRPRLWGVTVSHYQVEGGDACDWSDWEAAGRVRGGPCGAAVDSWTRYEEDGALARAAGANAFRFSVSWSRVEPRPGEFDEAALARYRGFAASLRRHGLEPVVTLFHYTHPAWFHERTPWHLPASVDAFALFARHVVEALREEVRFFIPLNEPVTFMLAGYLDAQIPPGIADARHLNLVFDHLLAAHVAAAAVIRELRPDAAVGIAHNMMSFAPERRWSPLDRLLTLAADRCYNRPVVEAFATGRWQFLLPPGTVVRGRRNDLPPSLDVFGINYYSRLHLRSPGRVRMIGDFEYRDRTGRGLTDNGWEIVPEGLRGAIDTAALSGLPLIVTENGLADATDRLRPQFLRDHLAVIEAAESAGTPVHGYFHWSLLDNFEWLDGYTPRFGLYEVDRATMARHPRPSVQAFSDLGRRFLGSI